MKESNSNTRAALKLLVGLLGALAFLVSYFLVLPKLQAQAEELEKENEILKEQQRVVTDLALNEDTYGAQTKLYEKEIADIIEKYPAYILEEDVILFARELETGEGIFVVPMIGMSPANLLYAMNAQLPAPGTEETETPQKGGVDLGILDESAIVCPDYNLFSVTANYDFETDYRSMKLAFAQILSDADKRNVPAMSLSRDENTGIILGNMDVNLYYMTNTGKIYHKPDPGVIVKGNDNPFGTLNLPTLDDLKDLIDDIREDLTEDLT